MSTDAPGTFQRGENLGSGLQQSASHFIAAVTCVALASLVSFCPPARREGKLSDSTLVLFVGFPPFPPPGKSLMQKQYFRFLSLFCQCQGDLLCHIT